MEVNHNAIRSLRKERGWTQQHLSDACGLSLRTVQRVEKYGNASQETVMSLCAVFEVAREKIAFVPVVDSSVLEEVNHQGKYLLIVTSMVIGSAFGAAVMYGIMR